MDFTVTVVLNVTVRCTATVGASVIRSCTGNYQSRPLKSGVGIRLHFDPWEHFHCRSVHLVDREKAIKGLAHMCEVVIMPSMT